MSSLIIAAIAEEQDPVWKISSEKVPHLTLLYLGDSENQPTNKIAEFLDHATNILEFGPFGLTVDRRDTLGENEADVLFFRNDWAMKRIRAFRSQLLKDSKIRAAYDGAKQFDEYPDGWTPHLTLGYPGAPAREDKREYPGFYWVQFDKIALWTGDFEGPEFRLEYNYDDLLEEPTVAMNDRAEEGKEFLEHFGVKGMRWGIRKEKTPVSTKAKTTIRGKTKVKAKGGEAQDAHPDAIKAATSKQKLKKSGTLALGNQELRELATRLQLEQQVTQLSGQGGKSFVRKTLENTGKQQVGRVANTVASRSVDSQLNKKKQPA